MMEFLQNKIFKIVSQAAKEQGVRAFVIGGYVRDCYLGRPCKDIDIVVEGSGIELAELVAKRVGSSKTMSAPPKMACFARVNLSIIAASPRCTKLPLITQMIASAPERSRAVFK